MRYATTLLLNTRWCYRLVRLGEIIWKAQIIPIRNQPPKIFETVSHFGVASTLARIRIAHRTDRGAG